MKVPYKEIFKLKVMLDEENIAYEFYDNSQDNAYSNGKPYIHYQIIVKEQYSNNNLISVIEGIGTYGEKQDLLEIMGCLTEQERKEDCVKGSLTAEEVLKRIKDKFFNINKDGSITTSQKVTLVDLEQNLINKLNANVGKLEDYREEIDLLKILLEH